MGFSLAGFGAGLAESIVSRIEEERKFSAAALQGRIERASIMKQQREKEQEALTEELRNRKNELVQFGIQDNDLQIAYLSSPMAFEALKKAQVSGLNVDPRKLITINQDKLFSGTADEFIAKAAAADQQVQPARVLPSEGRSMLAPSQSQEQRRFEQLAAMRGMTMEDIARAESGARPRMPEPAASINFAALQKEDKTQWPEKLKALETRYTDIAANLGENSPEALKAKNQLDHYRTLTSNLTEDEFDHGKKLSRARSILIDKTLNVSPEVRQWAKNVEDEEMARQLRLKAKGEKDDKLPSDTALLNIARNGSSMYLRFKYTGQKGFVDLPVTDTSGNPLKDENGRPITKFTYKEDKPEIKQALIAEEQRGAIEAMQPYMPNGRAIDRGVVSVLNLYGIKLDKDQKPIYPKTPPPVFEEQKPAGDSRATVKPPPSSAVPASAPAAPAPAAAPGPGRAGQGAASTAASSASVIADARDAISKGADRNAVIKRLRDMGITPPGDL